MATRQRLRFVAAVVLWTSVTTVLFTATGVFSVELLFIVTFVGLLIVSGMTAPSVLSVDWRTQVRRLIIVGFVVLTGIVIRRLLRLLPSSVV